MAFFFCKLDRVAKGKMESTSKSKEAVIHIGPSPQSQRQLRGSPSPNTTTNGAYSYIAVNTVIVVRVRTGIGLSLLTRVNNTWKNIFPVNYTNELSQAASRSSNPEYPIRIHRFVYALASRHVLHPHSTYAQQASLLLCHEGHELEKTCSKKVINI